MRMSKSNYKEVAKVNYFSIDRRSKKVQIIQNFKADHINEIICIGYCF